MGKPRKIFSLDDNTTKEIIVEKEANVEKANAKDLEEKKEKYYYQPTPEQVKNSNGGVYNLARISPERRKEISRKAGKLKHKNFIMREAAKKILSTMDNPNARKLVEALGYADLEVSMAEAIVMVQAHKALKGSTRSAEFIRDTAGEKPTDRVENINVNVSEQRVESFFDMFEEE